MKPASFPLLDEYVDGRQSSAGRPCDGADRLRRIARLWQRMQALASPSFSDRDVYLSVKSGGAAESHVDAYEGSHERAPHYGFRWGPDGQRLHVFMLTGAPDSGELHGTLRCWRDELPFNGHRAMDASAFADYVLSILQELILHFPQV